MTPHTFPHSFHLIYPFFFSSHFFLRCTTPRGFRVLEILLATGLPDVNLPVADKSGALHKVAQAEMADEESAQLAARAVTLLLQAGANPLMRDKDNRLPSDYCTATPGVHQLLLDAEASATASAT